jgi:predicted nucleic acid-binding protein
MTLLISDANIFIDMEDGGVIQQMFELPETFAVPDVLFIEELMEHHPELPQYGLQVLQMKPETVADAWSLRNKYNQTSQNDLLALALAKQEKCPLVTGDLRLRKAATTENIDVRGTLWLMERLFDEKILSLKEIEDSYQKMKESQRRLPWDEVKKQIHKFKTGKR